MRKLKLGVLKQFVQGYTNWKASASSLDNIKTTVDGIFFQFVLYTHFLFTSSARLVPPWCSFYRARQRRQNAKALPQFTPRERPWAQPGLAAVPSARRRQPEARPPSSRHPRKPKSAPGSCEWTMVAPLRELHCRESSQLPGRTISSPGPGVPRGVDQGRSPENSGRSQTPRSGTLITGASLGGLRKTTLPSSPRGRAVSVTHGATARTVRETTPPGARAAAAGVRGSRRPSGLVGRKLHPRPLVNSATLYLCKDHCVRTTKLHCPENYAAKGLRSFACLQGSPSRTGAVFAGAQREPALLSRRAPLTQNPAATPSSWDGPSVLGARWPRTVCFPKFPVSGRRQQQLSAD